MDKILLVLAAVAFGADAIGAVLGIDSIKVKLTPAGLFLATLTLIF